MYPLAHSSRLRNVGRDNLKSTLEKHVVLVRIYEFGQPADSIRRKPNRIRIEDRRNVIKFILSAVNDVGLLSAELRKSSPLISLSCTSDRE